jgi:gamma-glutamyltranspeptidase/glutathione hydrolase
VTTSNQLTERGVVVTKNRKRTSTAIGVTDKNKRFQISSFYHMKENDIIKYPALANTLKRITRNGSDAFKKETSKTLVAYYGKGLYSPWKIWLCKAKSRNQLDINIRI